MPEEFLTIREAAERTHKAAITIRRLIREVVNEGNARDRAAIKPTPTEVAEHRQHNRPFTYTISQQLLRERFAADAKVGESPLAAAGVGQRDTELVDVLKSELTKKDEQLKVKDEQIAALHRTTDMLSNQLNERLRESNVLMKGLQERLALPAAAPGPAGDSAPAVIERMPIATKPQSKKRQGTRKPKELTAPDKMITWWGRLRKPWSNSAVP